MSTFNDSSKTTLFELFMTQSDDCGYAFMVSKCFRKDLIMSNNLKFDKNLHHFEDQLFTLEYMKTCERINSISKLLYFYSIYLDINYREVPIPRLYESSYWKRYISFFNSPYVNWWALSCWTVSGAAIILLFSNFKAKKGAFFALHLL